MVPVEVRRQLLDPSGVEIDRPLSPGLSGSQLFRCHGRQASVLRRWPIGTATDRVREIHAVITSASKTCEWIPRYTTAPSSGGSYVTDSSGAIWELVTWKSGRPLGVDASQDQIRAGAAAIARVHRHLMGMGVSSQPAPAIRERLERTRQLCEQLPRCFDRPLSGRVHPSVVAPLQTAIGMLRGRWSLRAAEISRRLSPWLERPMPVQYVLRDIHRENMLFDSGRVSALIDFDAVRVDTVAVDLARWASSFSAFARDRPGTIENVLAGYWSDPTLSKKPTRRSFGKPIGGDLDFSSAHRPPSMLGGEAETQSLAAMDFPTLILVIADSSLWISLANWVVWLVDESRQFPDFRQVAGRLGRLTETVDRLANR